MLPTVEQAHVPRKSFPCWRVDALTQPHDTSREVDAVVRVQAAAAEVRATRSLSFLPLRARKAVMAAGSVRDGP